MDERIAKLPVWAQNHISDLTSRISALEASVSEAETALTAGPEDSDVFAEAMDTSRPLGKGTTILFGTGSDVYTVEMREGALHIDAVRDLIVEPRASYEVSLRMKD